MKAPLFIAGIQSASLPYEKAKLEYYLSVAKAKGALIVALGEYVVSLFFKELQQTPLSMIEEQATHQYNNLLTLSKTYGMTIIAPIVLAKKGKLFKAIVRFSHGKSHEYLQQILLPYEHWNEAEFFANPTKALKVPPIFRINGYKIGYMSGFEAHFDYFWQMFQHHDVDVVILPSVATFDSNRRWKELITTRAFTSNMYCLRVNRVGKFNDSESQWNFYGDTFLVTPDGEIEGNLGSNEEILIAKIDKNIVKEAKKAWQFYQLQYEREHGKLL